MSRKRERDDASVLAIDTKRIVRALILAVLFLTVAGLLARVVEYAWGAEGLLRPLTLFDVGAECNIPTWFSSFQLMLSSALLATIALAKKRGGDRYGRNWAILSLIFLLLSLDEAASIHEAMGAELEHLLYNRTGFEASGFIASFWVVPAATFVLVVALANLRFLAHLPRSTRRLFLVAGALYLGGALGLEMLEAQVISVFGVEADGSGLSKIVVGLLTDVEEMLEMLGVTVFVYMLLAYMDTYVGTVSVRVRLAREGKERSR